MLMPMTPYDYCLLPIAWVLLKLDSGKVDNGEWLVETDIRYYTNKIADNIVIRLITSNAILFVQNLIHSIGKCINKFFIERENERIGGNYLFFGFEGIGK